MESGIQHHRRASTHQRRPTEVLLHGSDAPACDRLRALRKAAVVDGLDGAARPVAWKLLLGVGRCDAKRYGALVARGPCGSGESIEADARRTFRSGGAARVDEARLARVLNALGHARAGRGLQEGHVGRRRRRRAGRLPDLARRDQQHPRATVAR